MKLTELRDKLSLNALNEIYENEIEGVFISDMVSDIVAGANSGNILVTIQTHKNLIATANLVDVPAIIYVRDNKPAQDVIELANRAKITLFTTNLDAWKLAIKLHEIGLK